MRCATLPSAVAAEHSETAVDPRGSVQPESDSAQAAGSGHAAGAEKPRRPGGFATFALSAVPDDDCFSGPGTYCRCWSARCIIFPLPHVSSPLAKYQYFWRGRLTGCAASLAKPGRQPGAIFVRIRRKRLASAHNAFVKSGFWKLGSVQES